MRPKAAFSRSELAVKLEPLIRKKAKANQQEHGGTAPGKKSLPPTLAKVISTVDTREAVAKAANVSHGTLAKAKLIIEHGTEETKAKLRRGESSINHEAKAIQREIKRGEFKNCVGAKLPPERLW